MTSDQKVAVFSAFRPFLRIMTICDSTNFRTNQNRRILTRNIYQAMAVSVLAFTFISGMVCNFWYCMGYNFNVTEVAVPLGALGNSLQFAIPYISIRMKMDLLDEVITGIGQIVAKRCEVSPKWRSFYERLEQRITRFTSIATKSALYLNTVFFHAVAMVPISYAIFEYPKPEQWIRVLQFSIPLPDDTNVVLWYYMDWFQQLLGSAQYYIMLLTCAVFFIGACFYIGGMVEDLKITLAEQKGDAETMTHGICAAIAFHTQLLEISHAVGQLLSVGIFFQLLICAATLAVYMVGIESNGNLIGILVAIATVFVTTTTTFVYCFLSENVTHDLSAVGDYFYNCAWYRLRGKQQQLIILSIQRAQVAFRFNGLGIVECSLRVFSSIVRATWSYFLVMHS